MLQLAGLGPAGLGAGLGSPAASLAAAAAALGLALRAAVGLWPHSGAGRPPMYGDFEAQRHWLEVTVNLPPAAWYQNGTDNDLQYWGLDYPPLTAHVSYGAGRVARALLPELVELHTSRGQESPSAKFFMRASVLLLDALVYIPAALAFVAGMARGSDRGSHPARLGAAALTGASLLLAPALLVIDHGHFQYNCVSLGLALAACAALQSRRRLLACACFTLALAYKQMLLYYAPAFFVAVLVLGWRDGAGVQSREQVPAADVPCATRLWSMLRAAAAAGAVVLGLTAATWLPLCSGASAVYSDAGSAPAACSQAMGAAVGRLFPLDRSLFEDKVSNLWCALEPVLKFRRRVYDSLALGEQGPRRLVLAICTATTLMLLLPSLVLLARSLSRSVMRGDGGGAGGASSAAQQQEPEQGQQMAGAQNDGVAHAGTAAAGDKAERRPGWPVAWQALPGEIQASDSSSSSSAGVTATDGLRHRHRHRSGSTAGTGSTGATPTTHGLFGESQQDALSRWPGPQTPHADTAHRHEHAGAGSAGISDAASTAPAAAGSTTTSAAAASSLSTPSSTSSIRQGQWDAQALLSACFSCACAYFLASYQVHEKSVLLPALAAAAAFTHRYPLFATWFAGLAAWSMWPLLAKDGLLLPAALLYGLLLLSVRYRRALSGLLLAGAATAEAAEAGSAVAQPRSSYVGTDADGGAWAEPLGQPEAALLLRVGDALGLSAHIHSPLLRTPLQALAAAAAAAAAAATCWLPAGQVRNALSQATAAVRAAVAGSAALAAALSLAAATLPAPARLPDLHEYLSAVAGACMLAGAMGFGWAAQWHARA